jgi:hypothetical protein
MTQEKFDESENNTGEQVYTTKKLMDESKFLEEIFWTSFHRWVRSVAWLPRASQTFSRKNDEHAIKIVHCQHLGCKDFRQLAGKTFRLLDRRLTKFLSNSRSRSGLQSAVESKDRMSASVHPSKHQRERDWVWRPDQAKRLSEAHVFD